MSDSKTASSEFDAAANDDFALYQTDPTKYNCKMAEESDLFNRPTFFKLHKGAELLTVGRWVIDPDLNVKDIVHMCHEEDKFYSPTVLVDRMPPSRKSYRGGGIVHKLDVYRDRARYALVCVTCGAEPEDDIHVIIELLQKRAMNVDPTA